jgi:hypothetical protein
MKKTMKKKDYMKPLTEAEIVENDLQLLAGSVASVQAEGLDGEWDLTIDRLNPKDSWDEAW